MAISLEDDYVMFEHQPTILQQLFSGDSVGIFTPRMVAWLPCNSFSLGLWSTHTD